MVWQVSCVDAAVVRCESRCGFDVFGAAEPACGCAGPTGACLAAPCEKSVTKAADITEAGCSPFVVVLVYDAALTK